MAANLFAPMDPLKAQWVLQHTMRKVGQLKSAITTGVTELLCRNNSLDRLPSHESMARNDVPFSYRAVGGYNPELLLIKREKDV